MLKEVERNNLSDKKEAQKYSEGYSVSDAVSYAISRKLGAVVNRL